MFQVYISVLKVGDQSGLIGRQWLSDSIMLKSGLFLKKKGQKLAWLVKINKIWRKIIKNKKLELWIKIKKTIVLVYIISIVDG